MVALSEALLFEVAGRVLAFPLQSIREVFRAAWPMPLPRPPFGCLGVLDVRGHPIPLLDLAVVLGLRGKPAADKLAEALLSRQVLLLQIRDGQVAVLVDRVLDVAAVGDLDETGREEAASLGKAAHLASAIATSGMEKGLVLRPEGLLTLERQKLLTRAAQGAGEAGGT